jgi:hypothetical protein
MKITKYNMLPENDIEWDDLSTYLFYKGYYSEEIQKNYVTLSEYRRYLYGHSNQFKNTPVSFYNDKDRSYIIKSIRKKKLQKLYDNSRFQIKM